MRKIRRELGMRFLAGFVTVIFLLTFCIPAFAGEPKQEKGYTYSLKQLIEQTEKNIEKVDEKLKEREIEEENRKRELEAREHFEKGNALYKEGKLKEAKSQWQKALEITKDPQMKSYVKMSERRARKEELVRKREEKEKQRRFEAEQREKERLERERQKQLELEKKEKLRKQKEEQARLERERKEKERLEKERQKQLELEKKEQEHRLNEQAKVFYDEAISLYNSKNYEQAQVKFEQASQVVPNYAKTDYYLKRIPQDIERQKRRKLREKIQNLNEEAKSLYRDKNYNEAAAKFNEVLALDSKNGVALKYLKLISKRTEGKEKKE